MKYFFLIPVLFVLTACQTRLEYPTIQSADEIQSVSKRIEQRPIAFDGGAVSLKRGDVFLAFPFWRWSTPNVDVGLYMCNSSMRHRFKRSLGYWKQGDLLMGNWQSEMAEYVETPLQEMGYDIVSNRKTMFKSEQELLRAELTFAAKIVDVKMNICQIYSWWDGGSQIVSGGDAYVRVDWEFYDPLRKRIVATITTEGIATQDDPVDTGIDYLMLKAIKDAARNLGARKDFYNIMTNNHYVPTVNPNRYRVLQIEADKKPFVKDISEHYEFTRRSVITVRTGSGHGSGFFINPDGYALTNAHVVGDAKTVAVIDFAGVQYMANVLRVDEERDVALIKADITRNNYLPVSKAPVKVTDTVYALGSPLSESLKNTITKGIVSAVRYPVRTELEWYQVNVEIAEGSSGGPLIDEKGNAIGVAVAGSGDRSGTSFAHFIPIDEALKYLNIRIIKPDVPL